MVDDSPTEERQVPIDTNVIARVAEDADLSESALRDALAVLDSELRGRHAELERDRTYVTTDDRRAYAADDGLWERLTAGMSFDDGTERAVRDAHLEQARLLDAEAVEEADFGEGAVVVGVDTAEEMT
ncbi:hypothetical protein ACFO0N_11430 [Halobium salinum]|uniref:DUF8048 domain-containing protein n=1 Tax=Halobium salinum TaxID=1364940 RepID=A0ABD5PCE1_9EURY|nr:hypothetical protein [Halobium salinum]